MAKQTNRKNNKKNKGGYNPRPLSQEKVDAITYQEGITVSELAAKIHKNASDIIKVLFMLSKMVTINS